jgi:HEPN domain-containing protein
MPEHSVKEWLAKAEEDAIAGEDILAAGHFYGPACFHFQQAVEKMLKGFLLFHNQRFPKSHDLLQLETFLLPFEPEIKELEPELDILNSYYIETRYPGATSGFTRQEAELGLAAMMKIKEFIKKKVK